MNTIELLKEELGELIESIEKAIEQVQSLNYCICFLKRSFRSDRIFPPYREKINPRGYPRRIYWHRIRSNPYRKKKPH